MQNIYLDEHLRAKDSSSPRDIKYIVTSSGKQGSVFNTRTLQKVREFTQEDIDNGDISFRIDQECSHFLNSCHFRFTSGEFQENISIVHERESICSVKQMI